MGPEAVNYKVINMIKKIRNLIKKAIITLILEDTANVQKAQVQYHDNIRDVEIISPYGVYGIAPVGSQVVLLQVNGQEENLVGIADNINGRLKDLKAGEIALYNTETKNMIKFTEDGDTIEVCNGDKTITITGDYNITVTGDCNLTADNVNIDASSTNLGVGGNAIARVGDTVQVVDPISGTLSGTITTGSTNNTSI